jgi:hypothetical protein
MIDLNLKLFLLALTALWPFVCVPLARRRTFSQLRRLTKGTPFTPIS